MLSKKRSRPIVVGNERYRWSVGKGSGYVVLAVQHDEANGQRLETVISTDVGEFWVEFPHVDGLTLKVIKPSLVSRIILDALQMGWRPKEKRSPLETTLNANEQLDIRRGI